MFDFGYLALEKCIFIFNEIINFLLKLKAQWNCFYGELINIMVNKEVYLISTLLVLSVIINRKLLSYIPKKYFQLSPIDVSYFSLILIYSILGGSIFFTLDHLLVIFFLLLFLNFAILLLIIDYKIGYLPNVLTFPFLITGLLYQISVPAGNVVSAIYAIVVAYLSVFALTVVMEKIKKQPQMGRGDFKLIAACAAWLGVLNLPYFLGVAAALGLMHYSMSYWVLPRLKAINGKLHLMSGSCVNTGSPTIPFGPAILVSATIWLCLSLIQ
ncbi:prepilin peptidase [Providencia rettgeri]|uniref:prepilin peptidase n=1 Tax=Providencia rettgeri TaxID=587 RepID=UPI0034E0847C